MNNIIVKTYELIDYLEETSLIQELVSYKEKVLNNNNIMSLLTKCHSEEDTNNLLAYRKEIYSYLEYQEYMKRYNELSFIILKINKKFKEFTGERVCDVK